MKTFLWLLVIVSIIIAIPCFLLRMGWEIAGNWIVIFNKSEFKDVKT